jgi:hypothetical protein
VDPGLAGITANIGVCVTLEVLLRCPASAREILHRLVPFVGYPNGIITRRATCN